MLCSLYTFVKHLLCKVVFLDKDSFVHLQYVCPFFIVNHSLSYMIICHFLFSVFSLSSTLSYIL